jgi:NAD(P)-dependent dehydrogenase (short-subunit alcohol dehydrogenase family)
MYTKCYACNQITKLFNSPTEQYTNLFKTNVIGTVDATNTFLPLLRKRGKENTKKILNMSSILGSLAIREPGFPNGKAPYSVSKTALNMITRLQANELAEENFIVYSAHPGWVATDMGGENAPVKPVDSIKGMLAVLDKLESKDNGNFIDFEGKHLPW